MASAFAWSMMASQGCSASTVWPWQGTPAVAAELDSAAQQRFAALKAWRAEVAREHNLPAYIVFNDATLAEIAAFIDGVWCDVILVAALAPRVDDPR